jgi:hypothetical protein
MPAHDNVVAGFVLDPTALRPRADSYAGAIIDDVEDSLATLTEVGRTIVGPAAARIRDAIVQLADREGWPLVSHTRFQRWIEETLDERSIVNLDPILRIGDGTRVKNYAVSRAMTPNGWQLAAGSRERFADFVAANDVLIIDDSSFSAQTSDERKQVAIPIAAIRPLGVTPGRSPQ